MIKRPVAHLVIKRPVSQGKRLQFKLVCTEVGCNFKCEGSTMVIARSNLQRHLRERHGDGTALARRRQQQFARMALSRACAPAEPDDRFNAMMLIVTCPAHREDMWLDSRSRLLDAGVPISRIRRRFGINWPAYQRSRASGARRQRDIPIGLTRCQFLMYDFHHMFLPQCQAIFAQEPQLTVIYWIEDDIKLGHTEDFMEIHNTALGQDTCLSWLGYVRVKGKPRWGTHVLGVHREGLQDLVDHLDTKAKASQEAGKPLSYLMGLDTWVARACAVHVRARPLAQASATSLASQRKGHPFEGRG